MSVGIYQPTSTASPETAIVEAATIDQKTYQRATPLVVLWIRFVSIIGPLVVISFYTMVLEFFKRISERIHEALFSTIWNAAYYFIFMNVEKRQKLKENLCFCSILVVIIAAAVGIWTL